MIPRRVATRESCSKVTLIVIDAVVPQQLQILFLKSFLAMMLALISDVFNYVRVFAMGVLLFSTLATRRHKLNAHFPGLKRPG
jgi:hypothetical protein